MGTERLPAEARHHLGLLGEAIFTNPFAERTPALDELGARGWVRTPPAGERHQHRFSRLVPALEARLEELERRGLRRLEDVAAEDRPLLRYAWLFDVFQRYVDELDALIQAQRRLGDEPAPVPFAESLLAQLQLRGFAAADAQRYLELFYQLRRAYFFIVRGLVGESRPLRGLRYALWNSVFTFDVRTYEQHLWNRMEDFSTLLLGPTGSGKGAAAAAIGRSGYIPFERGANRFKASFNSSFIAANLSAFPEGLIESELFGHKKGAFTGAIGDHQGLFERCSPYGSLFLDEIGELAVPLQIKLLTVLQERRFTPVGSHSARRFAGRIIAATNQPLTRLRRDGRFRDDFYYRLSSDVIELPTLRSRLDDRPEELEQLVELLLERMLGEQGAALAGQVSASLRRTLPAGYPWPGNVRELEQAVRRILLGRSYRGEAGGPAATTDEFVQAVAEGRLDARELLAGYCTRAYARLGSYGEVARRLGLDRRTVRKHVAVAEED